MFLFAYICVLGAQGFGRFGYAQVPRVAGLSIGPSSLSSSEASADSLTFEHPATKWRPVATSETEQTIGFGEDPLTPQKIRVSLTAPGATLYCPKGLRLHVASANAPYLTWTEGSVASGVPTPSLKWVVLSFEDKQPPLIFGFPAETCSLKVEGKPHNWVVNFSALTGWVRVGPLLGTRAITATTANTLGKLAEQAVKQASLYTSLPPRLLGMDLSNDLKSVTATWHFDREGAIVPTGATLANLGGYPIAIDSPFQRAEFDSDEGPLNLLTGKDLTIRFPVRRVPTGRGLGIGDVESDPLGTVAPNDIPSVYELALENLVASRTHISKENGLATYSEFFNQAEYATEPWSRQQLPYGVTGRGIDLCAAHALLNQALSNATKASSEQNSLLTSISWRRDWLTWRLCVDDADVARRAAALAALAGAICPEPERRLEAAMLQAGLAAERGLVIWRSHRYDNVKIPTFLEPAYGLRQALFSLIGPEDKDEAFVPQLLSPIRVYGEVPVAAVDEVDKLKLSWPVLDAKQAVLTLANGFPIDISKGENLLRLKVTQSIGLTELHYVPEFTGQCSVYLTRPSWVKKLPAAVPPPPYSEPKK